MVVLHFLRMSETPIFLRFQKRFCWSISTTHYHWKTQHLFRRFKNTSLETSFNLVSTCFAQNMCLIATWNVGQKNGEMFTLKHSFVDISLSHHALVPLPILQQVINSLYQSRFEPNCLTPPSKLISWLSSHTEFKFGHITDYDPIYRGPN